MMIPGLWRSWSSISPSSWVGRRRSPTTAVGKRCWRTGRPGAFELVVLDIYMGGATGMEVARRLRAGDGQVRLAFATSSNDFASESYEVGACYYLRKPFRPEGVRAMLERLDLEALERSRRLRLPDGSQVVLRSIRYAASDGHRVTLHCKDGDRTRGPPLPPWSRCCAPYPCFCGIWGRGGELPRGGPAGRRTCSC